MANATSTQLQELYVAYFGRAADPLGLDYWVAKGTTTKAFASNMYAQPEFKSAYGSLSTESQVNQIYKNLFDREADVAGLTYWTQEIKLGNLELADIAVDLIWAAQNNSGSSDDKAALTNRTNAAVAYTAKVKETTASILAFQPLDDGLTAGSTFSAGSNITEAKTYLSGIDKDTVYTAAGIAASVSTINSNGIPTETAVAVSKTFTSNLDNLVGTSANDSFDGVYYADGGTGTTAFPGDTVTGAAGTDTLTISVAGTSTAAQAINAITTTGVEKLYVTNYDANTNDAHDTAVDTSLMTGLTTIGLTASNGTGDTSFTGVKSIVATEMRNGSGDFTVTYLTDVVKGTADAATLTVSNQTAGAFTSDGIETLTINSEITKSTLGSVVSDKLTKLVVTGDKDLEITTAVNFVDGTNGDTTIDSTVDASAFTGGLTVTAEAMDQSITTGSGDDTINMVATLDSYDTVSAGTGKDTITLNNATITTQFDNVSGIEVVSINDTADAAVVVAADKLSSGVTEIILDANDATDGANEQEHKVTGQTTEKVIIRHTTEDDADSGDSDGNNYTVTPKTDGDADSITVEFQGVGNDTHGSTNYFGIDGLTLSNYETVNLSSKKTKGKDTGAVTDNELDAFTSTTATSVVVTGDADLIINAHTAAKVTSFDASALTGKLTLTAGAEKATYTGGSKVDTFTMGSNLTYEDTIIGGDGKDVVTATITGLTVDNDNLNIQDVEAINLTTSGNNQIDGAGITGASTVLAVTDNIQTITNFDLAQTIQLGLSGDESATSSEIDVTAKDATGAADTLKVKIENTNGAATSIIDASSIETLDLEVIAAGNGATLDLTTFEGDNVTIKSKTGVTATAALALGTLHKNTESVTSTYADKVTVSFASALLAATGTFDGTDVQTITGTGKGDTFTIGKNPSGTSVINVVTGGAGTDTVNITTNTGFVDIGSVDAENINVDVVAGTSQTLSTSFGTGVDNIVLTGGNTVSVFTTGTIVDAVKSVDASAFLGQLVATAEANDIDSTISYKAGALTTDELNYQITATGTDNLTSTGIEVLDLDIDETSTLNLASATGVTTIDIDVATTKTLTLDKLTGSELIKLTDAATGTGQVEAKLADATGSSDSVSFELKAGTAIADTTLLKTTDVETVNIKVSTAETISLANAGAITDADLYSTLKLTGDTALTVSATNADITTIDASGMGAGGAFIQTGRSATTASTYTGSTGNDTFIMMKGADVIDAAEKTSDADLLDVNFTGVLGKIAVDLSQSGDQVTTFNGLADATIQTNFEGVDLSGYTNYGSQVIGSNDSTVVDTVTATGLADSISLQKGADVYTMTAGNDVVDMGAGADTINITETLLLAHSGTTATLDGGAGADTLSNEAATINVADADFRGMSNIETFLFGTGTNTATFGSNSAALFTTSITGVGGTETLTLSASQPVISLGAGADQITTTEALMIAHSGTTSTLDGGTGTDILVFEAATINVVDADFRGISNLETLTLGTGTNNVVTGAIAQTAGIVTVNGNTGADTVTLHDGVTTYDGTNGGADALTIEGAYDSSASQMTINTGSATDDIELVLDAFQNSAADWGSAETNATDVDAADKWHISAAASGVRTLTIYNETTTAVEEILIGVDANTTVTDHDDVGSLKIDMA